MWREKLLNNNKIAYKSALSGWIYSAQVDIDNAIKLTINNTKSSYSYGHLEIFREKNLHEIEELNQKTDRSITKVSECDIAILGCGPTGMAMALYLNMWQPQLKVCIYEKRLNSNETALAPFTRHWLTHLGQSLISSIIEDKDLRLIKNISLEGQIGVDIRNLEYILLRAIKKNGIDIANANDYKYNSEFLIDATGGRLLHQCEGEVEPIGNVNSRNTRVRIEETGKLRRKIPPDRLKIAKKGNVIYPLLDGHQLRFAYLKINYINPRMQNDFINFAHSLNDFGVYFWNGEMKAHLNRALIFITLAEEDYLSLRQLVTRPTPILNLLDELSPNINISRRSFNLFKFIGKHHVANSAIVEPPFEWNPYFIPRSDLRLNETKYINIGDSYFNGNPMVGNGLAYHLQEIKEVFD